MELKDVYKMKRALTFVVVALALTGTSSTQVFHPAIFLEPQSGFETYLAAAFAKKGVPAEVVVDSSKAKYVLKSAPVEVKVESTGGKIARCKK